MPKTDELEIEVTEAPENLEDAFRAAQDRIEELQGVNAGLKSTLVELKKIVDSQADAIKGLVEQNDELHSEIDRIGKAGRLEGDYASWKGEIYPIVGDYRADNTFHHVKTRDCEEGLTLLAIPRPH